MRDHNYPSSYFSFFPPLLSRSFFKILLVCGGIFLNFLESSPSHALPVTSSDPHKFPPLAGQPTAMPLPAGLKTPSAELPSFHYTSETQDPSSNEMKYNPEAKEAIRNDAQPL